jgi:alkanesulfonate monooxygenase SsuD/methylene tetrahydromethanopterin reductase-like flavin-dependent oxidoreductase (luciferase family)
MRTLWAGPHAEFHGEFIDFEKVTCSPRPVNGNIPILVGGDTDAAIRRAVRLADGYFPGEGDTQKLTALLGRVRAACDQADRDYKTLEVNAMFASQMANPEQGIEDLRELGVGRIMLPAFFFAGPGGLDRLSEFAEKYISNQA